jgi:hypothetical protein
MKTIKVDIKEAVKNYAVSLLDRLQCDVDCIDKDYVRDIAEFHSNLEALTSPDVTTKYTTFRRLMKEGNAMFLLSPEQFDVLEGNPSDCNIELVESLETRLGVVFGENCNF